jgi:hypothetical protein
MRNSLGTDNALAADTDEYAALAKLCAGRNVGGGKSKEWPATLGERKPENGQKVIWFHYNAVAGIHEYSDPDFGVWSSINSHWVTRGIPYIAHIMDAWMPASMIPPPPQKVEPA